jgi:hypothetical protein
MIANERFKQANAIITRFHLVCCNDIKQTAAASSSSSSSSSSLLLSSTEPAIVPINDFSKAELLVKQFDDTSLPAYALSTSGNQSHCGLLSDN